VVQYVDVPLTNGMATVMGNQISRVLLIVIYSDKFEINVVLKYSRSRSTCSYDSHSVNYVVNFQFC